jgi:hypothetical protein
MLNMLGISPEEIKRYLGLAYNELIRIRRAQERQAEALEEIKEVLKSINNRGELIFANEREWNEERKEFLRIMRDALQLTIFGNR